MSAPDGGPAFPVVLQCYGPGITSSAQSTGISMRDWFAGQAMSAKIEDAERFNEGKPIQEWITKAMIAESCYRQADAMIAERNKQPKEAK